MGNRCVKSKQQKVISKKQCILINTIILISVFALGFGSAYLYMRHTFVNSKDKGSDTSSVELTLDKGTEVKKADEISKVHEEIKRAFDSLEGKSIYCEVVTGDNEFDAYMKNSKGEVFAQSSDGIYTAVFKDNGETVKYNDNSKKSFAVDTDIDVITLLKNVNELLVKDIEGVSLYKIEDAGKQSEYIIDIKGEQAIKEIYRTISNDLADYMYKSFISSLGDKWEPRFMYSYKLNDDTVIETACLVVIDNKEYTNWVSGGFLEIGDWSLDNAWYTTDFSNEQIDTEIAYGMVDELVQSVEKVIKEYAEEKGLTEEKYEEISETLDE